MRPRDRSTRLSRHDLGDGQLDDAVGTVVEEVVYPVDRPPAGSAGLAATALVGPLVRAGAAVADGDLSAGSVSGNTSSTTHLSDEQRIDWLRLIRSEHVGPRGIMAQTPQAPTPQFS